MNKIPYLLVFLLLTIITLEVVYYLFVSKKTVVLSPSPKLTSQIDSTPTVPPIKTKINKDVLNALSWIDQGIHESSIITNVYKGKITRIETALGVDHGYKYTLRIDIVGLTEGNASLTYNEKDQSVMQIFTGPENQEQKIALTDLKVGDSIMVKHITDMTKPWGENMLSISIRKNYETQ